MAKKMFFFQVLSRFFFHSETVKEADYDQWGPHIIREAVGEAVQATWKSQNLKAGYGSRCCHYQFVKVEAGFLCAETPDGKVFLCTHVVLIFHTVKIPEVWHGRPLSGEIKLFEDIQTHTEICCFLRSFGFFNESRVKINELEKHLKPQAKLPVRG